MPTSREASSDAPPPPSSGISSTTFDLSFLEDGQLESGESESVHSLHLRLEDLLKTLPSTDYQDVCGSLRLLRFLRGYQGDVDLAEQAFRSHITWRRDNKIDVLRDEILTKNIQQPEDIPHYAEIVSCLPMNQMLREGGVIEEEEKDEKKKTKNSSPSTHSSTPDPSSPSSPPSFLRDYKGNLIAVDRYGEWDINRVMTEVSEDHFERWSLQNLEFRNILLDRLSRSEHKVIKVTMVQDMAGLSIRQISRQALKLAQKTMGVARDHYPEGVYKILILNAPWMFSTFWRGISTWMRQRTIDKVSILGGDYDDEVFTVIPREHLPPFLGGVATNRNADVPLTGLLKGDLFALGRGAEVVEIPAGKAYSINLKVDPGARIEWAWGVQDRDLGFSVRKKIDAGHKTSPPSPPPSTTASADTTTTTGKSSDNIIIKYFKATNERASRGDITIDQDSPPSSLVFEWDNTYSYLRGKTLHYKVSVFDSAAAEREEEEVLKGLQAATISTTTTNDKEEEEEEESVK